MIENIFADSQDENPNLITKNIHNPKHHKTVTKTSGPGFETVVVTEVFGNHNQGLGGHVLIPIFPKRIHLKRVNKKENPFKIFQDLDSVFESFFDAFAEGFNEDDKSSNKTNNSQKELKDQMHKLEDMIKDDNVVITNVRDITKEVKE